MAALLSAAVPFEFDARLAGRRRSRPAGAWPHRLCRARGHPTGDLGLGVLIEVPAATPAMGFDPR
jgi:hypothetical protein